MIVDTVVALIIVDIAVLAWWLTWPRHSLLVVGIVALAFAGLFFAAKAEGLANHLADGAFFALCLDLIITSVPPREPPR